MNTNLLVRDSNFNPSDIFDAAIEDGIEEMAREAERVLDYQGLTNTIKLNKEQGKLINVLSSLGIKPFTKDSVKKYKEQALQELDIKMNRVPYIHAALSGLFGFLLISTLVSTLITSGMFGGWVGISVFLSHIAILAICSNTFPKEYKGNENYRCKWDMLHISLYQESIPAFVLDTALKIKKACPSATLSIDSLGYEKVVVDPFLVVSDSAGETYYIEVWNEPKFRQEREI